MFRKTALVMTTLAALAMWANTAEGRGGHCGGGGCGGCGGGGCGYSGGGCGYGGCASGGCAAGGCSTCAAAAPAAACPTCVVGGGTKTAAASTPTPAYITVSLPADATLTINDRATSSTSSSRTFVTPSLEDGKDFTYTLTMQVVRDGKMQTVTKDVTVQAGKESKISLALPTESVAAK